MAHRARWRPRPAARGRGGRLVSESTAIRDRSGTAVAEAGGAMEAPRAGSDLVPIVLIRAGWSLNGNYWSADVLRRDAAAAWPSGTLSFVDHATEREDEERPAGSMTRLAGYLVGDARWDEQRQAVVGTLRPFALWREAVLDWAASKTVGMSIRAYVEAEQGEAEGRRGEIVRRIYPGGGIRSSVDIVTVPAAGGALGVAESAGAKGRRVGEARSIGVWLESRLHLELTRLADDMYGNGRLTRPERITLSSAIGDALRVWTERVESEAPQLFQRDIWDDAPEADENRADEAVLRRPAEATTEEMRRALSAALRAQYASQKVYVWLCDYDADRRLCWYEVEGRDSKAVIYQQAYSIANDGRLSLAQERIEVVPRTVYEPVASQATVPTGESPAIAQSTSDMTSTGAAARPVVENVQPATAPAVPANNPKEESMTAPQPAGTGTGGAAAEPARTADTPLGVVESLGRTQAALTEALSRIKTLEAEIAEKNRTIAKLEARDYARDKVTEALEASDLTKSSYKVVLTRVVDTVEAWLGADGKPDDDKLKGAIAGEIAAESVRVAKLLEEKGVGKVQGLGAGQTTEGMTEADFEAKVTEAFQRRGLSKEAALVAARGRS